MTSPAEGASWAADYVVGPLLGWCVRIRSTDYRAGEYMRAILGGERGSPASGARHLDLRLTAASLDRFDLWIGDTLAAADVPASEAPARALAALNRWICFTPGPLLVLHAAAAARSGGAVALIGDSGAGKSSLVAALVCAGWTYLSDEAIGVDADANFHPYLRPITLRRGSWSALAQLEARLPADRQRFAATEWHVPALSLDAVATAPMPPRAVVLVRHEAGARADLRPITRGAAIEQLVRQSCNLSHFGQDGLDRLAAVVRQSSCFDFISGSVGEGVGVIETGLGLTA